MTGWRGVRLRRSGTAIRPVLACLVASLPFLGLLLVLVVQIHHLPVGERLRLLSVEGTPLYYNPAAPRNPDLLLSDRGVGLAERRLVADYLLRRPVEMLLFWHGPGGGPLSFPGRAIVGAGALLLDAVLSRSDVLDLALLLEEGGLPGPSATGTGAELEREGFRGEIRSTLSESIQQNIRSIVSSELQLLREDGAYQAAVVVLEREADSLRLRAIIDTGREKGLNGALLVRHSGSVLKPFLYALTFERFGWRPRTIIEDTPLHLPQGSELYEPRNHDNKFAGSITVREALASSRNIPAVRALLRVGGDEYVAFLREAGLTHLGPASRYGPTLALGTGGASTLETALLFSILASGGEMHPLLLGSDGSPIYLEPTGRPTRQTHPSRRLFSAETAMLITHILMDRDARRISFSRRNFLDFPFDVAAKTGTSQSYRDSWTAGYTDRYVVAVWVGNFSGRSMAAVSGLRGAARIFHQVVRMLVGTHRPSFRFPGEWRYEPVCRATGRPTRLSPSGCPSMVEVFLPGEKDSAVLERPGALPLKRGGVILSPFSGQVFYLDPHRSEGQRIPVEFAKAENLTWSLHRNGHPVEGWTGRPLRAGRVLLHLDRGSYELSVHAGNGERESALFYVR